MINKNNSVECHASYHEGLLKFFAVFRMTTQHQTKSAANQFFAGDASAPPSLLMQLHQWASTTKLAVDVSK